MQLFLSRFAQKQTMLKLLLFFLLFFIFLTPTRAQELPIEKSKSSFIEWNFGLAFISEANSVFPGTSVLWGSTYINENNFIFEYGAGFALPSLVTGKIGIGKKFNNTKVIIGVRPFPFNLYLQSSFPAGKRGYWIGSLELNPLGSETVLSFGSKAIFNFGYRWDLTSNK
jgi:hypothetical protein